MIQETVIMCGGKCFYASSSIKEDDLPKPVNIINEWQAANAGWRLVKHPWLDPSARPINYVDGKHIWSCKPVWLCPECYNWHEGRLGNWASENEVIA